MYTFAKGRLWKEYSYEVTVDDNIFLTLENGIVEARFFAIDSLPDMETIRPYVRLGIQMIRGEVDASAFAHGTKEYILAWTTTPWTIPAHMALAVNANCEYVGVLSDGAWYIVAAALAETVFRGHEYTITQRFSGADLVGLSYTPPFDYYAHTDRTKNHRIYHADFITDTDGTGIGHEAPEFGDVDFELAREHGIHVSEAMDEEGKYTHEIADLQGTFYRDANAIVMERLTAMGKLFRKEGITHRVPFCPRSKTPLMQKAQKSWFINIQSIKSQLLAQNENINWFPDHLKHGRFMKGVESAPDWCISRTRYWGAPMPVWRSEDGSETVVAGSRDEIYELSRPFGTLTRVILVRHGRTDYNEKHHFDTVDKARLTDEGKTQAQTVMDELRNTTIDVIYSSPMSRCMDTITPLAIACGLAVEQDARLWEYRRPTFQDKQLSNWADVRWENEPIAETDETSQQLYTRVSGFLDEILKKHAGKTVVICTHGGPLLLMRKYFHKFDLDAEKEKYIPRNGHPIREYIFADTLQPLDLHRPYIDRIQLQSPTTGATLTRIPEVLDVWMDSGAMPYAQMHYPFANKQAMEASFPADFIAEYVGQVRAWFYVMHVLGVVLFDAPPFKNVAVTGIIYGTDGRKMSKSYGNYPDPRETLGKHGGDALRYYLLSGPLLTGGDINFSEEGIVESVKKVILPLWNAYSFFTTYANIDDFVPTEDRVWFVRHGETDANAEDRVSGSINLPLNEK